MLNPSFEYRLGQLCSLMVVVALVVASTGCGSGKPKRPPVAVVKGKVLLDGQPLESGSIETSVDSGRGALGAIHGGQFELSTYGTNDGALLGKHRVAVISREKGEEGPEAKAGKLLIPERYTNPQSSGLTIEVKAGDNTPTLELKSP